MSQERHLAHPTPSQYWRIAVVLGVVTAIEVAMFYVARAIDVGIANAVILLLLAALKFAIVVGWYMHLRFEKTTVAKFFTGGLVLAISLYLIVLAGLGVVAIRGA